MATWFPGRTTGRSFTSWPKSKPVEYRPKQRKKRTRRSKKPKPYKCVIPVDTAVRIQRVGHYTWDDYTMKKRLVLKPLRYTKKTKRFTFFYEDYYITVDEWLVDTIPAIH